MEYNLNIGDKYINNSNNTIIINDIADDIIEVIRNGEYRLYDYKLLCIILTEYGYMKYPNV